MTDDDRHLIPTINYQHLLEEVVPNRTAEEFAKCRAIMQSEWFAMYVKRLEDLGYDNDGDGIFYEWGTFVYVVDHTLDSVKRDRWWVMHRDDTRIVVVHGFSTPTAENRDDKRLQWHGHSIIREFGESVHKYPFDKGHYIAHSLGGHIDNGIFAQRRAINRGWSDLGKKFRAMEIYAQKNPGTFVFSRPIYGDGTLHPFFLEYGVLRADWTWWIEVFPNRYTYMPYSGQKCWTEWFRRYIEFETEKQKRREERSVQIQQK
ncbi:MAG: hypothetical protein V2A53_04030 [bacterium]